MTVDFIPDPNPYRDYLEGRIDLDTFAAGMDGPPHLGPTNWSFEDWWAAAEAWVNDRPELGLWPFQARQFGRATAWTYEGATITEERLREAWEYFLSGRSNGPHSIPLDGYDYDLWHSQYVRRTREKFLAEAHAQGVKEPELSRMLKDWEPDADIGSGNSADLRGWIREWLSGTHPQSPHHVPLDPENIAARIAEVERISQMDCYRGIRRWKELADFERPNFPKVPGVSTFSLEDLLD